VWDQSLTTARSPWVGVAGGTPINVHSGIIVPIIPIIGRIVLICSVLV